MPVVREWLGEPVDLPWFAWEWSMIKETQKGPQFNSYPLWWLVPYLWVEEADYAAEPGPVWVAYLHPDSPVGKPMRGEGSFQITPLPPTLGAYLEQVGAESRRNFRRALRDTERFQVRPGTRGDLEAMWPIYVARIQELNRTQGAAPYTEEELQLRWRCYTGPNMRSIAIEDGTRLVALALTYWDRPRGSVYAMSNMIRPDEDLRRLSLGTVCTLRVIEAALEVRMGAMDLGFKSYGWKHRFATREVKVKHFLRCSRAFAAHYELEEGDVSELTD
jgi:hypothetical protein